MLASSSCHVVVTPLAGTSRSGRSPPMASSQHRSCSRSPVYEGHRSSPRAHSISVRRSVASSRGEWYETTRGRPTSRDIPSHHPGRLPGDVRLLLAMGSVAPAHVLLPSLRRLMRTARRSSPQLILCLWWHSFALWPGCWRPCQRAARSVDL